ncbi:unnamed protein product [Nesidiocoris tenuis]|uniref:Progestin and adipoQ receptor family member 4 n=1 Tax=Nesidiocoris tenuis TaxID=355587 RepID=A0A6H5G0B1_9HEMI|nr:unnamed protein product [Nesidiocoris tenuis]
MADGNAPPRQLLLWRDMPRHLQFNPYIHTGYRPLLSFWGSLGSLFYMHNETINIFTHGESHTKFPFMLHYFSRIDRNNVVSRKLTTRPNDWKQLQSCALPMVCASVFCLPRILQWLLISCYCIFAICGLFKALSASSPWNRRLCFALPFCMRNLLCVLRLTRFGGGNPANFSNVVLQDLLAVIGGAIGACNVPEKWLPGSLDMYFNSHNIMHVLVVSAVYYMYHAARKIEMFSIKGCRTAQHQPVICSEPLGHDSSTFRSG